MAFTYAYANAFGGQGLVLVVEEPEAHLHPLAQQWVAAKLTELVSQGVQIILTTHSPYFLSLARPGTAIRVYKDAETAATRIVQLRPETLATHLREMGAPQKVTAANVGAFYENSSTSEIKAGLFARACALVEGQTEALALPELLRRAGTDVVRQGIAFVPVSGVSNLAKWVRYFRAHKIPVYAIFDTDSDKTGNDARAAGSSRRDALLALGLDGDHDWMHYTSGPIGVNRYFSCFDANYERAMRTGALPS